MSIVLLIDGYNVIGPVAPPGRGATGRWLAAERKRLLDRLAEHLDENVRWRTCVVFDAKNAPSHLPSHSEYQGIEVVFSRDYPEADDLLEELIATHPAPRTLSVVSSDHRIARAARRRRAGSFASAAWLDNLLDGTTQLIKVPKAKKSSPPRHRPTGDPEGTPSREINSIDAQVNAMVSDEMLDELLRKLE